MPEPVCGWNRIAVGPSTLTVKLCAGAAFPRLSFQEAEPKEIVTVPTA